MKKTPQAEVREMIVDMRGGVPAKCDFCREDREEQELHPEEGGEWACIHCIRRWDAREGGLVKGVEEWEKS